MQNSKMQLQTAKQFEVEADASSASYFWGISALTRTPVSITNLPDQSLQGDVIFKKYGEAVVTGTSPTTIDCEAFPDAAMTLACICAVTPGTWKLTGLQTLRDKECDRLAALKTELTKMGCRVSTTNDSLTIKGGTIHNKSVTINTYNDHRMAMCFGMLQILYPHIKIENPACVRKTFPQFWKIMKLVEKKIQKRNVVIIGMRGAGKSELGKKLTKTLSRKCIDLDAEITKNIRMPIAEYVKKHGWSSFRKKEKLVTRKIAQMKNAVISCGGGTILDPDNTKHLKENGLIVYLSCELTELQRRLSKDTNRPTIHGGTSLVDELPRILQEREPLYRKAADLSLDVSTASASLTADLRVKATKLAALVRSHGIA